jgi:TPR repeat protein
MKKVLYFFAISLAILTAVGYGVGKGWEKDAHLEDVKLTQSQRLEMLKQKAAMGDGESLYQLGLYYEDPKGERHDYLAAQKWYRAAASRSQHKGAKYKLGDRYLNGRGVENNLSMAMKWFKEAAYQGDARAQYFLAVSIRDGWERKQDFIEAYKWFSLANRDAKFVLDENPNYDTRAAMVELERKMSSFDREEAEKRAKAWVPTLK